MPWQLRCLCCSHWDLHLPSWKSPMNTACPALCTPSSGYDLALTRYWFHRHRQMVFLSSTMESHFGSKLSNYLRELPLSADASVNVWICPRAEGVGSDFGESWNAVSRFQLLQEGQVRRRIKKKKDNVGQDCCSLSSLCTWSFRLYQSLVQELQLWESC